MGSPSFDMRALDPGRAIRFYNQCFGWRFQPLGTEQWRVFTAKGQRGIGALRSGVSAGHGLAMVEVASLDAALERVCRQGGRPLSNVLRIPGGGRHVCCVDPEGNLFAVCEEV